MSDKRMSIADVVGKLRERHDHRHRRLGFAPQADGASCGPSPIRRLTDLTLVSYGGPDVGLLVAAGKVQRLVSGFVSLDSIALEPHFRAARQRGEIEFIEVDEGMLQWGLLAAAQRLPFLPIRAGLGSDVMRVNPQLRTVTSPYDDGEELVAMPALTPRRRAHPHEPGRCRGQRPVPRSGPVLRRPVLPGRRAAVHVLRAHRRHRRADSRKAPSTP